MCLTPVRTVPPAKTAAALPRTIAVHIGRGSAPWEHWLIRIRFGGIFNQITGLFPRGEFEQAVRRHNAERHARGFRC